MLIDTHFHLDLMDNMHLLITQSKNVNVGIMAVGVVVMAIFWYQINKAINEYIKCEEEFSKSEKEFEKALREYERYVNEAGD